MDRYDAVIIGAGSAGMSYAALLAKKDKKVFVIDKRDYPGGRAATRKAEEWGWNESDERVNYGPHILPAKGYAQLLLDILGIDKRSLLKKSNHPYIYRYDKIFEIPANFSNMFQFVRGRGNLSYIRLKEKVKLLKLLKIAYFNSLSGLIRKYERMPICELVDRLGISSSELLELIVFITGSAVQNLDLTTCPALDLLVMLKLMMNGVRREKAIMYEVRGGYGSLFDVYRKIVEQKDGVVVLGKEAETLMTDDGKISGIITGNKKISGKHTVFSGAPRELSALLEKNGLPAGFLSAYENFGPASVIDLIILSKTRIHKADTNWLYLTVDGDNRGKTEAFYAIIEEGIDLKDDYLYHICCFSSGIGKDDALIGAIKRDIQRKFNYDFSTNVKWDKSMVMDVHGTERTVEFPYSQRVGPETPLRNLFVIGDSYKALTTGTDGCAYSALQLAEKILNMNFKLNKAL